MKPHSVFKVEVCFYAPFKNGLNTKKVGRNEEDNDWLRGISVKSGVKYQIGSPDTVSLAEILSCNITRCGLFLR